MGTLRDHTGEQYNHLLVLGQAEFGESHNSRWRCRCACGKEIDVYLYRLTRGTKTHCGCLRASLAKQRKGVSAEQSSIEKPSYCCEQCGKSLPEYRRHQRVPFCNFDCQNQYKKEGNT